MVKLGTFLICKLSANEIECLSLNMEWGLFNCFSSLCSHSAQITQLVC